VLEPGRVILDHAKLERTAQRMGLDLAIFA
jgi:hypothetical protein